MDAIGRRLWVGWALVLIGAGAACGEAPNAEEVLWQQAIKQYRAQSWIAAATSFQRIATRPTGTKRIEALFYAGESCMQTGQYREAAFLLGKHLELGSTKEHARQARFRFAEASYFAGDYGATAKACAEFRQEFGPQPQDEYLLLYVGRAALELGDPERAEKLLAELRERFPMGASGDEAQLYYAKALLAKGDEGAAREQFEVVAGKQDESLAAPAILELARLDWKQGHIDAALAKAGRLEQRFPKSPLLAEVRLLREAAAWLKKPARDDRSWRELVTRIQNQPGGDKVLSAAILVAAARRMAKAEDVDAALVLYETVSDTFPKSLEAGDAILAAAAIHTQEGRRRDAAVLYAQLARDQPHSPRMDEALSSWAALLVAEGQAADAEKLCRQIHDQFPASSHWPAATLELARAARKRNDREAATRLTQELAALRDIPVATLSQAFLLQAELAADAGRWAEIGPLAARLVKDSPQSPECEQVQFLAADAALRLGDVRHATETLESLATRTPPIAPATAALVELRRAQLAAHEKRWPDALDRAANVPRDRLPPRHTAELDLLRGRALLETGKFADARQTLLALRDSPALAGSEEAATAAFLVGETFQRAGQDSEAIQAYLRAEILHDVPNTRAASLLQAARCYERLGRRENALKLYARLVEQYPQTPYVAEAARCLQGPPERTARAVSP